MLDQQATITNLKQSVSTHESRSRALWAVSMTSLVAIASLSFVLISDRSKIADLESMLEAQLNEPMPMQSVLSLAAVSFDKDTDTDTSTSTSTTTSSSSSTTSNSSSNSVPTASSTTSTTTTDTVVDREVTIGGTKGDGTSDTAAHIVKDWEVLE